MAKETKRDFEELALIEELKQEKATYWGNSRFLELLRQEDERRDNPRGQY